MIRNATRRTILARTQRFCVTPSQSMRGLMFTVRKEDFGCVLVFRRPQRVSLHMWFVPYPIDVVYCDAQYRVVDLKRRFLPFTFTNSRHQASYAVEVPAGAIDSSKTRIGDVLAFETGEEGAYPVAKGAVTSSTVLQGKRASSRAARRSRANI